jgi:type II secretion system protein D
VAAVAALASTMLPSCTCLAQKPLQIPTATPAADPADAADSKIESYRLTDQSRPILTTWQQATANRTDIRVAIDERTAQALVFAPPAVHAQIRDQLGLAPNPPVRQSATSDAATVAQLPTGLSAPAGTVIVELSHMPASELHTRLERLLSRQLPATVDASGDWQGFAVEASPGTGVTMNVNTATGQVRIDGPPLQVAAWRAVVEALDSPPTDGSVTQLVATKRASQGRVRQALEVLRSQAGDNRAATTAQSVAMLQQQADQADDAAQPDAANQPAGDQPTTQVAPSDVQTALDAAQLAEAAGGLLGPVQVEYVEGLDVIVLRGADRDVQRVIEIINQIEALSAETVPTIEIHPLQSVDSVQMAVLLNRLYTDVLGPRIGTVNITPLGKPNALLLIGREENVRMAIGLIQRLDQPAPPAAQFQVFPLQNASAAEAKALIDAFLMQDEDGELQQDQQDEAGPITDVETFPPLGARAVIVADIRTNYLIVRASPRDLAEIAALIERIDEVGATAQLKVFTIRNGDAAALVTTLRTLFAVPTEGEAAAPGGISQGGVVRLQFSVDPRTNSIIAAGSADDLAVVEAILLRLDEGGIREGEYRIYRLKNAFAQGVADALTQMLLTQRQAVTEAAVTISPFEQVEREVVIVAEPATNSLLIHASRSQYQRIEPMIEELDERPPMVMIQVLIGEVRLNDTDEFGVELGLQDSLLFDRSALGTLQTVTTTTQTQSPGGSVVNVTQQDIVNAPGQPGFNFNNQPLGNNLSTQALATAANVATQGLSSFSLNRVNNDLGFGGFVFSASSSSVSVLLRALQENRRLEVLSRPQLMALDGQIGYVQVGQNVPRIVQTSFDALTGTTNTIQYEPVGLILQVVPRISPDGLVVLQIIANKSEVGPEAEGIPISVSPTGQVLRAPRIEITQAQTTVSALSGQTVVLGGLLQTRKFDVHRRVPLIADIPLIGDLFRYDSVAEERRELLIILTPRIVYGKEDSDLVKQIESSRMSWILGDTVNLHGEVGLRSRCDEWNDADIEAVFPHHVPEEGLLPLSKGQEALGIGSELSAPYLEPSTMPAPATTPRPVYDSMPMPEQSAPTAPLPPQTNQAPTGVTQPAAAVALDKYGFVDMAASEEPQSSRKFPPLRLPEESE